MEKLVLKDGVEDSAALTPLRPRSSNDVSLADRSASRSARDLHGVNKNICQMISSSPFLGVYCAFLSAAGSPLHLLTAAMIHDVGTPMILLVRSLEHVVVFAVLVALTCDKVSQILVKDEILPNLGHAIAAAASIITVYYALAFLPSADVYVISCATPIFATVGGYFFLKEKFGVAQAVSAVTVAAGAVIITKPSWMFGKGYSKEGAWIGTLLSVLSCVCTTAQALLVRKLQKTSTGFVVIVVALVIAFISIVLLVISEDYRFTTCGSETALLLAGGAAQIVTNGLVVLAGKLVKAGRLSVIKTSAVLFTYVFQIILVGEIPTWHSLLGGALILASVLLTTLKKCNFCGPGLFGCFRTGETDTKPETGKKEPKRTVVDDSLLDDLRETVV